MSVGPWQLVIIVLIILLLFGAGRLSEIGKGLGEGIRNFKKGISGDDKADEEPPIKKKKKKKKRPPEQLSEKTQPWTEEERAEDEHERVPSKRDEES